MAYNGTTGDDTYQGGSGSDLINGNDGNDILFGNGGFDTINGNAGNDVLQGGALPDIIYGGEGDDDITGGDSLFGTYSVDFEDYNNQLYGEDGNDTIGGAYGDVIDGGAGIDTLFFRLNTVFPDPHGLTIDFSPIWTGGTLTVAGKTISNMEILEEVDGSAWDDRLTSGSLAGHMVWMNGFDGNDVLIGGAGNELMKGGSGTNALYGLDGDDRLWGYGSDTLDGGNGSDSAFLYFSGSTTGIVADFAAVTAGGTATYGGITLTSIEHFEVISGSAYDDFFDASSDTGGAYTDRPEMYGMEGNDTLIGNVRDNRLDGGAGNDTLVGGAGNDSYYIDSAYDVVVETVGGGIDTVHPTFDYTLAANIENLYLDGSAALNGRGNALDNSLYGNSAANHLKGMDGADTMSGNDGNDILVGGAGRDMLYGGAGTDDFRFNPGDFGGVTTATSDRINDFSQAQGDKITLVTIDAVVGGADDAFAFIGNAAFSGIAGELRYQYASGTTTVYGDTNGDGVADFAIALTGNIALTGADFNL